MMKKLATRNIEFIELFLKSEDMNYITLSKHDLKILYEYYTKGIYEIDNLERKIEELNSKVEDFINMLGE